MSGETNLNDLLRNMSAELADDIYVFVTLPDNEVPAGVSARLMFREAEGTTLIVTKAQAIAFALPFEFPCRMITLTVHSSLEAVGLIARVASVLAAEGMGVNPVSGFFHDHLFVPEGREQDAMKVLSDLARAAGQDG